MGARVSELSGNGRWWIWLFLACGGLLCNVSAAAEGAASHPAGHGITPAAIWIAPFAVLLLAIALLPLIPRTAHWWEHNRNKLLVALVLAAVTCLYYGLRDRGYHGSERGLPAVKTVLEHAVVVDYIPFIVLLFSLYVISGGINLAGDIPAHPVTNTVFLGIGALLASFIGTTGASMLLIRPLLSINRERKHVRHTVIFFIFLVSNIGGSLLPIGDPPLFLGYLRGVPFLWTLNLAMEWAFCVAILLTVYYAWDTVAYRREVPTDIVRDETVRIPLTLRGKLNFLLLLAVVLSVGLIVPEKKLPGTDWTVPHHARELVLLGLSALSMILTAAEVRKANQFNFVAITEVAFLFVGIFITMQAPIEILKVKGPQLGVTEPWQFFWATGALSSFLDNAPTYVVFFETANTLTPHEVPGHTIKLLTGDYILDSHLTAVSLGAVFMGANTYIGNGPNFMVKSIAEQSGVKMPSFFGYMAYSIGILIPLFLAVTFVFIH